MRLNKKAQFFLIAALILSAIILSFGKVYNTARIEKIDTQVEEFSEEIQYEASRVIDNGLLQGSNEEDIESNLETLTQYYGDRSPDSDIEIIYGDKDNLKAISYDSSVGLTKSEGIGSNARLSQAGDTLNVQIVLQDESRGNRPNSQPPGQEEREINNGQEKKQARIINRQFELREKQNFYVVVKKKVDNDQVTIVR